MPKFHRSVIYFPDRESARVQCAEILGRMARDYPPPDSRFDPLYGRPVSQVGTRYPRAIVREYGHGFAVQYYPSGPYFPELEA